MTDQQKQKLTLELVQERLQQLPLLPAVLCDLMTLDRESDDFYQRLTELAKSDPSLAARVLQMVNSAASSPVAPITDLHQALVRVGAAKVLAFVSQLSVARVFTPVTDAQKHLWRHALQVAYLSEFLAQQAEDLRVDACLAYSCGLLHDIGRFVLFEMASRSVDVVDSLGWDAPDELPENEFRLLGFTHVDVGYLAAQRWNLPPLMAEAIHYHHKAGFASGLADAPEVRRLVMIMQVADAVAVKLNCDPQTDQLGGAELAAMLSDCAGQSGWQDVAFPAVALSEALAELVADCEKVMAVLHID